MVFEGWSRPRIAFTVFFSFLFVSGVALVVAAPEIARENPAQYAYLALDALIVAVLVLRPDLVSGPFTE